MRYQDPQAGPKQIMDVVSESDSTQWIVLLDNENQRAELIPVISSPDTDKKLVLWNEKQSVNLTRKTRIKSTRGSSDTPVLSGSMAFAQAVPPTI